MKYKRHIKNRYIVNLMTGGGAPYLYLEAVAIPFLLHIGIHPELLRVPG
jgi:hypothetical protein